MKPNLVMNFSVNKENNSIKVERAFAASLAEVWAAWTESDLLDQWWAPRPWKTETKSMDFREGGFWLYAMVGPEGEKHWCRLDYKSISVLKSYVAKDAFCDENGNRTDFPQSLWENEFVAEGNQTIVRINISYEKLSDLEQILEMGFKEGFTAGLQNLDELLAQ